MGADPFFLRGIGIEPLARARHDRSAFLCGEPRIDNYLKNNAARNAAGDFEKIYVAVGKDNPDNTPDRRVIGFYVVCPHAIDIASLPPEIQKTMPRRPTIGAIYLSIIGVDRTAQGQGLGSLLMADAFRRCAAAADAIGGHFIVLDALNPDAARFYRRLGFIDLPTPGSPNRMLISMAVIRKAMGTALRAVDS